MLWLKPDADIDARVQRPDPANFNAIIEDAIDLRQQCGEGALPLAALLEALPKDVPLSVELRSKALRDHFPDPADRAREVVRATRQWLQDTKWPVETAGHHDSRGPIKSDVLRPQALMGPEMSWHRKWRSPFSPV